MSVVAFDPESAIAIGQRERVEEHDRCSKGTVIFPQDARCSLRDFFTSPKPFVEGGQELQSIVFQIAEREAARGSLRVADRKR